MYNRLRRLLFHLDPETAHHLTLGLLRLAGRFPPSRLLMRALYAVPEKPVEVFGLRFMNPVGLAAGYDKDGIALQGLAALGFGHLEVGTVTLLPQTGNPKPRIFRLVDKEAVINRMGFPGKGMAFVSKQTASAGRRLQNLRLGVNLGKNKDTPLEEAIADYITLLRTFLPLADYLAINISSPNTVGLRRLQGRGMLENLLTGIARERALFQGHHPILVKLAPDLTDAELDDALEVIQRTGMDGVIVTNTTLNREGFDPSTATEEGGLSGRPLKALSEAVLQKVVKRTHGQLPVISVGGIMSPEDAKRRLGMGAALVQVYTGLVYAGPRLVRDMIGAL